MSYIEIELTGKVFAKGLETVWMNEHDGRLQATKYAEDVVQFVSEMLDEFGDPSVDRLLRIMLTNRAADRVEEKR